MIIPVFHDCSMILAHVLTLLVCILASYNSRADIESRKSILEQHDRCPVSNLINTPIDGYLPYPMDIFDPEQYDRINTSRANKYMSKMSANDGTGAKKSMDDWLDEAEDKEDMSYELFKCTSSEIKYFSIFHPCSKLTRCPVNKDMLKAAKKKSIDWKPKHSLCHFKRTLHFTDIVPGRVFVLGGSVTAGTMTGGCCCNGDYDKKCKSVPTDLANNTAKSEQCIYKDGYHVSYQNACRWPTFFLRWIKSLGVSDVTTIQYANGGTSSSVRSMYLPSQMHDSGITSFRKDDIVLIDHSVNDALQQVYHGQVIYDGLQNLVRKVFSMSDEGSWPSVIILANLPFANTYDNISYEYYADAYRKVAKYWQLPLWSYRDAVWDVQATNHSQLTKALPYLRWDHNDPWCNSSHPPWFVSMFYADMISSLLLQELHDCNVDGGLSNTTRDISEMRIDYYDNKARDEVHELHHQFHDCDEKIPPLLHHSAEAEHNGKHGNHSHSKITVNPIDTWPVVVQRSNKIAWVDEDTAISIANLAITTANYTSSIAFSFEIDRFEKSIARNESLLVRILSLKTYYDAGITALGQFASLTSLFDFIPVGVVDVFLCGKYIGAVDALWDEYDNGIYHNSVIHADSFIVPIANMTTSCQASNQVELRRLCRNGNSYGDQLKHPLSTLARASHKFALFAVKVCSIATT
jgi:hypothetical protein